MDLDPHEVLLESVNFTGFPLQLALAREIEEKQDIDWAVVHQEYSWKNNQGSSGFVDLVLEHYNSYLCMIVECKRVRQDQGEKPLIFLTEKNRSRNVSKCFIAHADGKEIVQFRWVDLVVEPQSPESMFCIYRDAGAGRVHIEKAASELVEATEAIAGEFLSLALPDRQNEKLYVNVLVTNAPLMLCEYEKSKLNLVDGVINEADFKEVPFLRLRKHLIADRSLPDVASVMGSRDVAQLKENTVYIVNSKNIIAFLSDFDIDMDIHQNHMYLRN